MTALITGASSGIGRDIARTLAAYGCRVIITGRNLENLQALKAEIDAKYGKGKAKIIVADLSQKDECIRLYEETIRFDIDILVNNAGFGTFGAFDKTDLDFELEMIDVNIKAVHILTKLFLLDFKEKDHGYILNVASAAGFMAGPFMSTYYSTKNYVVRLTEGINEELASQKSNVYVGALCPGPVSTNFGNVAGVHFGLHGAESDEVAQYAVEKMLQKRVIIIPKLYMKVAVAVGSTVPSFFVRKLTKFIQTRKELIKDEQNS